MLGSAKQHVSGLIPPLGKDGAKAQEFVKHTDKESSSRMYACHTYTHVCRSCAGLMAPTVHHILAANASMGQEGSHGVLGSSKATRKLLEVAYFARAPLSLLHVQYMMQDRVRGILLPRGNTSGQGDQGVVHALPKPVQADMDTWYCGFQPAL